MALVMQYSRHCSTKQVLGIKKNDSIVDKAVIAPNLGCIHLCPGSSPSTIE